MSAKRTFKAVQRYRRANIPGQVIVHDESHFYVSPLNNVSAGGCFMEELTALAVGTSVRLVIKSPELEHPVQALGIVVRIENGARRGMAIEFTSISKSSKDRIEHCAAEVRVEKLLSTSYYGG